MKRFALLPIAVLFTVGTLNTQNKNVTQVSNTGDQPYKVANRNLSIGNMAYAQKVLLAWKDFDNNNLDNSASLFTNDILATFPDGTVVKGKENFLKSAKEYRNSFASVSSTVDAITTLKTPDHPDMQAVTIWGVETDTAKDGKVTKTHLNEIWFFNKEGKVYEFHQMAAKDTPENQ